MAKQRRLLSKHRKPGIWFYQHCTNSTSETLVRIQQMGVARWMISSALSLVIAQRLVRKLCPHCRKLTTENTRLHGDLWPRPLPRWRAEGCERCYHGFYGRVALFEVLYHPRCPPPVPAAKVRGNRTMRPCGGNDDAVSAWLSGGGTRVDDTGRVGAHIGFAA